VRLKDCKEENIRECAVLDLDDPKADFIYECKEDFICTSLEGIMKCDDPFQPGVPDYKKIRGGTCKNITHMYQCTVGRYSERLYNCRNRKADCLDLKGMFECYNGACREMFDYHCERRCTDISCDKNTVIQSGDTIFVGDCSAAEDAQTGAILWKQEDDITLLANCISLELDSQDPENSSYIAKDCINGTLYSRDQLPDKVNYTELRNIFTSGLSYKNKLGNAIPFDIDITMFNETKLKMNHEGCSNSLSQECTNFHIHFGKDGRNYTSPSRFPCYYTNKQSDFVIAQLNLKRSYHIFLIMLLVPLITFVFSCFFCVLCSSLIVVDAEGHMHMKGCYDWFKKPPTEYEKWAKQHQLKKLKAAEEESLRLKEQEEWMKECHAELDKRKQQIMLADLEEDRRASMTDIDIKIHMPK